MNLQKLLRFLTGRMSITMLLILIQVFWMVLLVLRLIEFAEWIPTVFQVLGILVAFYIVGKDDVSAYRMAWIFVILVMPVLGGMLYLLFGNKRPAAHIRNKLKRGERIRGELLVPNHQVLSELEAENSRASGTFKYVSDYAHFPVWSGTDVSYYSLGEEMYADMLTELKKAKRFIFLEYFIIEPGLMWDSILDILAQKVKEGVDVRLIYDDMGCVSRLPSKFSAQMKKLGIRCFPFNRFVPFVSVVMNHRDHRKIMVIDGHTAFTGGVNLADEYINRISIFGHWKDTGVRLTGDAAWSFTVMFLDMWNSFWPLDEDFEAFRPVEDRDAALSEGFVQPFCDSPLDGETVSVNVFLEILAQAKNYVYISTPYLAISDELQIALCLAAKRGVDVRLVLPGIPDKKLIFRLTRSYYHPLMKTGVKIYEYTPGFLHAKSYVCDDETAMVGTINMDYRSLYLHFECGVLMCGVPAIEKIRQDAEKTFAVSHQVQLVERDNRTFLGFFGALFDSILRMFATLF